MAKSLVSHSVVNKHILDMHAVSYYFLVATFLISALLIFATWFFNWTIWLMALLVMVAWMPLTFKMMTDIFKKYQWVALLFVMVVAQGAHTIEHIAQVIQLHLLNLHGLQASGLIGGLNNEWVHLIWNSWVLLMCPMLLFHFRKNPWLWILFIFAIYHEAEHIVMVASYLRTGLQGSPGLLAHGGLIGGGLPISRPDLHFLYALFEESVIFLAYYGEIRKSVFAQQASQIQQSQIAW